VNLLQDTLAALALATDPPTLDLLNRKPEPKGSSLISFNMWKVIFGQSVVQLVVIFLLNFTGTKYFPAWDNGTLKTVVFNTFVWLQIFNEINCRRLDNKLNVFSGIQQNSFFIGIMIVMVGCQTLIIFFGGGAFSVTPLDGQQWLVSVGLGFLSMPAGAIIRLIPNDFIKLFIPNRILEGHANTDLEQRPIEDWDDAMEAIQDDLRFFKRLRGQRFGRTGKSGTETDPASTSTSDSEAPTRQPSFDNESRESHSSRTSRPHPSSFYSVNTASTMLPGLIALSAVLAPIALSDKSSTNQEQPNDDARIPANFMF
jgi:Ca2+-transporting ATPase